ncbi:MAG TPA: hypothetical protein VHC69_10510 [Polyangiaceae bacterium]|nr:hypothetical protein [Polyangiaceae bacterium]
MRRLSRRTLLAWAGLGVVAPACLSPTLPLPPPDAPDVEDLKNGYFRLQGALPVYATVLVRNQRTHRIDGDGPLNEYNLVVAAESGDTMILWYLTDSGDQSSPIAFELDRLSPIIGDGG